MATLCCSPGQAIGPVVKPVAQVYLGKSFHDLVSAFALVYSAVNERHFNILVHGGIFYEIAALKNKPETPAAELRLSMPPQFQHVLAQCSVGPPGGGEQQAQDKQQSGFPGS